MIYRLDDFELDTDRRELRRLVDGQVLELQAKVFDVLAYLVRNADRAVSKDELLDRVWEDVNVSEASLTRCISLGRRALGESETSARIIETLRGHGYRIGVAVTTGQTAEPLGQGVADTPAPPSLSPPRKVFGPLKVVGAFVLVLITTLAWLARPHADLFLTPTRVTPAARAPGSIAVLPFAEAGGIEPVGIGELLAVEIIRGLGSIDELTVISASSAFKLGRGFDVDPLEAGRTLGVDAIVVGELRRESDRIGVSVELADTSTGTLRWSSARSAGDSDAEFGELRRDVVREITRAMGVIAPDPVDLARAAIGYADLAFYRGGHADTITLTREMRLDSVRRYEEAIELEPERLVPYVALAMTYEWLWTRDEHGTSWLDRGEAAALRALQIDPRSPQALTVYGSIRRWRKDWNGAMEAYRLAIEYEPTAEAYEALAQLLCMLGRPEEALEPALEALGRDPLSPWANKTVGRVYYYLEDGERAAAYLLRAIELDPRSSGPAGLLSASYRQSGRAAEAREAFLLLTPPWTRPFLRIHGRIAGDAAGARLVLALDARAHGRCGFDAWETAIARAAMRDEARAFECLDKAADHYLWYVLSEPAFDPYRDDPRFLAALAKAGFPTTDE